MPPVKSPAAKKALEASAHSRPQRTLPSRVVAVVTGSEAKNQLKAEPSAQHAGSVRRRAGSDPAAPGRSSRQREIGKSPQKQIPCAQRHEKHGGLHKKAPGVAGD